MIVDTHISKTNNSWFAFLSTIEQTNRLEESEKQIFSAINVNYTSKLVKIPFKDSEIYTIHVKCESPTPVFNKPIVLVHGFGAGVAMWGTLIKSFSKWQDVIAFDLLGFGRSSRPDFSTDENIAESEMVEAIEMWRKAMDLEQMYVVAHSFGGYLSTAYSIKYPQYVVKLVLADPWGFDEAVIDSKGDDQGNREMSSLNDAKYDREDNEANSIFFSIYLMFNPLFLIRVIGQLGPAFLRFYRPDLKEKYSDYIYDYFCLCNSQNPTGEVAFRNISQKLYWAKNPMSRRFHLVDKSIKIVFIHGSRSWINRDAISEHIYQREGVRSTVIEEAGHHVYADNADRFADIVFEAFNEPL